MKDNEYNSNCYGFVYAGLKNSEDEFFKNIDDLKLHKPEGKGKITEGTIEETKDQILDSFDLGSKPRKLIELMDNNKMSQHIAFLNRQGEFYDQNGPDGDIRLNQDIEALLYEYQELFGNAYYQVYSLTDSQNSNIENFLKNLL